MLRKILLGCSWLLFLLAAINTFRFNSDQHWVYVLAFLGLTGLFFLAAWDIRNAILLLLLSLPFLIQLNNVKINVASLFSVLGSIPLSVNFSAALYLFLTFLLVLLYFFNRSVFQTAPLKKIIGLNVALICLSVFWSSYPDLSVPQAILSVVGFVVFFLSFFLVKDVKDFFQLLLVLSLSGLPAMLVGFSQFVQGNFFYTIDSSLGRIAGPFHHPNNFGIFLFIIAAVTLIILMSVERLEIYAAKERMKLLAGYFVLILVALVLTYSRTSWVALVIFVFLFLANNFKKLFKIGLMTALVIATVFLFEVPRERIVQSFERSSFDSIQARQSIFTIAWEKFQLKPVLGYGVGTFEEIVRSEKENFESSSFPHNDLILFTLEQGVVGIVLFVTLNLMLLYLLLKIWKNTQNVSTATIKMGRDVWEINLSKLTRGVAALLVTSVIVGLAEATYRQVIFQIVLWSVLGGFLALVYRKAIVINDAPLLAKSAK